MTLEVYMLKFAKNIKIIFKINSASRIHTKVPSLCVCAFDSQLLGKPKSISNFDITVEMLLLYLLPWCQMCAITSQKLIFLGIIKILEDRQCSI